MIQILLTILSDNKVDINYRKSAFMPSVHWAVHTIDPLNNANLNGKIECMRIPIYAFRGIQNKHRKCIIVFATTSSVPSASSSVYLRYLNFIYLVCASQMAYISLLFCCLCCRCSFMPKWCTKFDYKPTHSCFTAFCVRN